MKWCVISLPERGIRKQKTKVCIVRGLYIVEVSVLSPRVTIIEVL